MLLHGRIPACVPDTVPTSGCERRYWVNTEQKDYFSPKCRVPEILTPHAPPILGHHTTKVKENAHLSWIIQHLGDNPNPPGKLTSRS